VISQGKTSISARRKSILIKKKAILNAGMLTVFQNARQEMWDIEHERRISAGI
jgi:hypothetical protein